MEAEIGVSVTTSQGMPGTPKSWKRLRNILPRAFAGSPALPELNFGLLASRTVGK